ncbi:PREDICTED: methylenetetrahydrofolate reductase, partial [Ceratosolen solmsi marchali]|uniref:Methylenetetrahydrofolate reductase n=1 Tax=Ceratosolen solmsi marchali TaxID=326594 RepID=A0AAJ6YD86_9HYME
MRHRVVNDERIDRDPLRNECQSGAPKARGQAIKLTSIIEKKTRLKQNFCSFELFPTKNPEVYQRETERCAPAFYALTWYEKGVIPSEPFSTLKIAENFPGNVLLHCAARGLKYADVEKILRRALELDIVNIFVLQGDTSSDDGDFQYASDLVTFIRKIFGQQFCICVAGYPEMHPQSPSKNHDLFYLKAKVNAGADFIITQFCFEYQLYIQFIKDCRKLGITVPIIPGIYPITNARLLNKITSICSTRIPPWIQNTLQVMGEDNEAVKKFGIDLSVKIIQEIRKSGVSYGYHLFTLNRPFPVIDIYDQLNIKSGIDIIIN